jgi:predicted amidophosphoribosyltransferase
MPTFKHPCPHCGTFINRDVAACPACGRADPFAPARCPNCRATIDDPSWVACPACGQPVGAAAVAAAAAAAAASATETTTATATETISTGDAPTAPEPVTSPAAPITAAEPEMRRCSGCGAPLASGVRFCRECGTVAD